MQDLSAIPLPERLELLSLGTCRPLPDAKQAIGVAIARFHESWSGYRTLTPTLYLIGDGIPGVFVTLGRLRKRFGLNWGTIEAVVEALESTRDVQGFLVAAAGVGGDPPTPLFTLQGHDRGERQYGALDLTLLTPFEGDFATELDLGPAGWRERWTEAASNGNLLG